MISVLFCREKYQKLLINLVSCFQKFVHLSGDFTPSSTSLRGIPLMRSQTFSCIQPANDESYVFWMARSLSFFSAIRDSLFSCFNFLNQIWWLARLSETSILIKFRMAIGERARKTREGDQRQVPKYDKITFYEF